MKRRIIILAIALSLGVATLWAVAELQLSHAPDLPSMMPEGALLYLEAKDFGSLIREWNESPEKRAWLTGDNYLTFSNSRLFARLSQAQEDFSTAAGLPVDNSLLSSIAGTQSSLGLYDIGNLEFVYVTRMGQHDAESTPLWQIRAKFEQRIEGASSFYVHRDAKSNRTAAFAVKDGWLILGTKEELVARVIDRIESPATHSLADEAWYSSLVKSANAPQGDLRMALNLDRVAPSPYFRSYWVQRNVAEMKQYTSALSDLFRTPQDYREERILLRKTGLAATTSEDVQTLMQWVPEGVAFYSVKASSDSSEVLSSLREDVLDRKSVQMESASNAPPAVQFELAGSASMLEEKIDQAPVVAKQSDAYEPLRTLLRTAEPTARLQLFATHAARDSVFIRIDSAEIVEATHDWNDPATLASLSAALHPGLTVAMTGLGWVHRATPDGTYYALEGQIPLCVAIRGKSLLVATSEELLQEMFAQSHKKTVIVPTGVTYQAGYEHNHVETRNYSALVSRLDRAARGNSDAQQGQAPSFFSGNIESLSRMFAAVDRETIQERDQGSKVLQTVIYRFQRHDQSTGQ